jgi:flagellar assembly protein FliH
MVRRTLAVHPEIIVPLVKDALTQLGSTNAPLTITLHPSDAALVRTHLAESMEAGSWKILEDANLQRGGCLLQSATSHMDATVGTRWQHLTSRLGIEEKWLD